MSKFYILLILLVSSLSYHALSQELKSDTLPTKTLNPVTIKGMHERTYLPNVSGVNIFAGKKTNVITINNGEANLPQNVGRMIFAKIPGINLWDMDGAGTQLNIGTRGTDAHRCIEMNMRQNGYNTNSDLFGYPENHYTVPMQGVKQVQLVRGSAALQFGSQFGGMMNFVMKEGDSSKVFSLESEQTTGSYNFYNSYNAIGGTVGKVSYYAYYDNKHGDGWRPNAAFNYQSFYANIKYKFSGKGSLSFQFSRMDYRQQIAGGLTDIQFNKYPRQSFRSRNFFSPKINLPALILDYSFSKNTLLKVTTNGIWGERSSVQFINTPNIMDTVNTLIGSYNPRQVDRDFYQGFVMEGRLLHHYKISQIKSTLATGIRYSDEQTKRRQKGKGTTGSNYDMTVAGPYGIDLLFRTINYAVFAENVFQLNERFSVTPGFRYEVINSNLTGVITNATFPISYKGTRTFPLFGVGVQYQSNKNSQFYGNISQAYRPYLYANITPADQLGVIDPNLKDSRGYDVDMGYRGQYADLLKFDINGFYLFYGNKIGNLTKTAKDGSTYQFTTNIGNSVAKGFEAYLNLSVLNALGWRIEKMDLRLFTSIAYTHARYVSGALSKGTENISLVGNHVEGVPDWINRSGIELNYRGIRSTFQVSHTSQKFSDANNTVFNNTGVVGIVPSYAIFDWSFSYKFLNHYHVSTGVNNIANVMYFSRRINMYPGPGILPADGRTFYFTLGLKI